MFNTGGPLTDPSQGLRQSLSIAIIHASYTFKPSTTVVTTSVGWPLEAVYSQKAGKEILSTYISEVYFSLLTASSNPKVKKINSICPILSIESD